MKNARPSAFRLRRAYLGLSLRDVAAELGVSHDTVWRIERGERPVQPEEREKLARILGLSPTETLTLF